MMILHDTTTSYHTIRNSLTSPKYNKLTTHPNKTYQNCLQTALRIKRDEYVNKNTNLRKTDTKTVEYITVIQDLKHKNLRTDYKNNQQ